MSWNYRVIRYKDDQGFGLHEVHYEEGTDKPKSRTENAAGFVCHDDEGKEGVIKSLEIALADAKKHPVLDDPWPD